MHQVKGIPVSPLQPGDLTEAPGPKHTCGDWAIWTLLSASPPSPWLLPTPYGVVPGWTPGSLSEERVTNIVLYHAKAFHSARHPLLGLDHG